MSAVVFNEPQLCALLRIQDRQAYNYLYDHYSGALLGEIHRIVHDESVAEDILQEVFISFYQKLHTYDPAKGRLFTWMVTLARNRAIDYLRSAHARHHKGLLSLEEDHQIAAPAALHAIEYRIMQQQIRRLEPPVQDIVHLVYTKGMTHEQVAETQQIPLGTVKSRLRKGLNQLRASCMALNVAR